ncbi:type II toxin-antitoxin system VapC family toxin (plasmid) [Acuticoccus sp. MNP-M23]|uniref:type II toxin-antitoxin system VapC family toxin n=1 Tax=Acuticoccus sp. MNP-M23 TaxID=3072793 RepID=UPI002815E1D6|nr:type II toxin-antitoxin system VapC family toxin [Acuticoccus sp. MNP-M23]WMS45344.1 type II toxin-antitoxin system VapC family toxin [Acuticoccus sp. MNP-M23]
MTGVLLDTNVISELTRPNRDAYVIAFLEALEDGYVSTITLHELTYGLERLQDGARRQALAETIERFLSLYQDRILPVSTPEARAAAVLRAGQAERGRVLHLADALIAATALVQGLTIATRNIGDFEGLGVVLHNPWQPV